jgi:hypothetical protein
VEGGGTECQLDLLVGCLSPRGRDNMRLCGIIRGIENRSQPAESPKLASQQESLISASMCGRVDLAPNREPTRLPARGDEVFEGLIQDHLHARVFQPTLRRGVANDGKVVPNHPRRFGGRGAFEEERDRKAEPIGFSDGGPLLPWEGDTGDGDGVAITEPVGGAPKDGSGPSYPDPVHLFGSTIPSDLNVGRVVEVDDMILEGDRNFAPLEDIHGSTKGSDVVPAVAFGDLPHSG